MDRHKVPLEQFAGSVPTPIAVYRPAGIFGGLQATGIPFAAIAMLVGIGHFAMAMSDLDEFRSIEEYATYEGTLDARMKEIDAQYKGQPLPADLRSEWADLTDIKREVGARRIELAARLKTLETLASNERNLEVPERGTTRTVATDGGASGYGISRPRHVPEDIFALEQYRGLSSSQQEQDAAMIDAAKMAIDRAVYPHPRADQAGAKADLHKLFENIDDPVALAQHVLATGSPTYGRAVIKYAAQRDLDAPERRILESSGIKALTLGTDAQGGYAVPFTLDPTLILTSDGVTNPIRQISRVERVTGKKWEGVASGGITASYAASETDEVGDDDFTLTQPTVETHLAHVFVPFSITLEVSNGALRSEIANVIQDAKDTLEANKFVNGSGSGEPFGVLTLDSGKYVYIGSTLQVKDLFSIDDALPPRYQPRASWIARKSGYSKIRQLSVGTSAVAPGEGTIWVRGIAAGNPPELLLHSAYEASGMPAFAANAKFLLLGDFNRYLIADRIGLTVEVVPLVMGPNNRPTNQRGVYAYWNNGADILDDNAFRLGVVGGGGS